MYTITDIKVIALDVIEVTYSSPVITGPQFFDLSKYSVSTGGATSLPVTHVLNKNPESYTSKTMLAVRGLEEGTEYTLTCQPQTETNGTISGSAVTANFVAVRTKLDSILSHIPSAYDKSPTSLIRQILTAAAIELDYFGGPTQLWEPPYTP